MSVALGQSVRREGPLLLADISGYTRFLQSVADAHRDLIVEADEPPAAFAVLSHLLDTMVGALEPTFRLAKLEGDAIFAVADGATTDGEAMIDSVHRCYAAFRGGLAKAGSQWMCYCAACSQVGNLSLKFVVHHGTYIAQSIAGREEFLGSAVNVAHRLLKNHARELVGSVPYALVTDATVQAFGISTDQMVEGVESYDDTPAIPIHVLALESTAIEGVSP